MSGLGNLRTYLKVGHLPLQASQVVQEHHRIHQIVIQN